MPGLIQNFSFIFSSCLYLFFEISEYLAQAYFLVYVYYSYIYYYSAKGFGSFFGWKYLGFFGSSIIVIISDSFCFYFYYLILGDSLGSGPSRVKRWILIGSSSYFILIFYLTISILINTYCFFIIDSNNSLFSSNLFCKGFFIDFIDTSMFKAKLLFSLYNQSVL